MSDSVQPHRRQPTRLPCPWDSPGKNTGVGCHFLLQCMIVKNESEVTQSVRLLATPWTAAHQAPRPWDFPGKSTRVGCYCLLHKHWVLAISIPLRVHPKKSCTPWPKKALSQNAQDPQRHVSSAVSAFFKLSLSEERNGVVQPVGVCWTHPL